MIYNCEVIKEIKTKTKKIHILLELKKSGFKFLEKYKHLFHFL